MAQNNQKGKGKKKGGPKLRPPKTLEPLLKDPNYLVNLCNQRGRKQGTTALDEQIPRILKAFPLTPKIFTVISGYFKSVITHLLGRYFRSKKHFEFSQSLTNRGM